MKLSIKFDSREFERAFRRLAKDGVLKAGIKGVNSAGKEIRKALPGILQSVLDAPKKAFKIRAKAAHQSQKNPAYRVNANRRVPVAELRAAARKITKKPGAKSVGELSIQIDSDKKIKFKSVRKTGSGPSAKFELLKAGPLPGRRLGGVIIGERRIRSKAAFKSAAKRAEAEGLRVLSVELEKAIKRSL